MNHPHADRPLLILVGPTAVGKTALSLHLAERFNGEVISADSRLLYRGMDIGTAKPTAAEQAAVPHHLIDVCDPNETLTLGEYQDAAYAQIDDCHRRGTLPMLVGGTGQYVRAIVEGWGIPRVAPRPRLRRALEAVGGPELHRWLTHLDPAAAERIHPNNVRRVVRALEVTLTAGYPITHLQEKKPPPYRMLMIGLRRPREVLHERIDRRVELMLAGGLVDEVRGLLAAGYGWRLPAMSGLGYRQLRPYLEGEQTLAEAAEKIKTETNRFVRQQQTWFHPDDERIVWVDAGRQDLIPRVSSLVAAWQNGRYQTALDEITR